MRNKNTFMCMVWVYSPGTSTVCPGCLYSSTTDTHVAGQQSSLIADDIYDIIMLNAERLDSEIIYDRDFDYDYFGFKTLERSYLLRINGDLIERPQHMLMRVSVGIHREDIDAAVNTYNLMSERWFIHASPTLFNSGTPHPQLSSCFLVAMKNDSIEGIYDTLKECAVISKSAGGIGLHMHNIRAVGSALSMLVYCRMLVLLQSVWLVHNARIYQLLVCLT